MAVIAHSADSVRIHTLFISILYLDNGVQPQSDMVMDENRNSIPISRETDRRYSLAKKIAASSRSYPTASRKIEEC